MGTGRPAAGRQAERAVTANSPSRGLAGAVQMVWCWMVLVHLLFCGLSVGCFSVDSHFGGITFRRIASDGLLVR